MPPAAKDIDRLIKLVRRCFQLLRAAGDDLHADLGMTASLRAVLESLYDGGAQTVPQIARAKGVSRQHIQKIADSLIDSGHVAARDNPDHRRSVLIALTGKGRVVFEKMRKREAGIVTELAGRLAGPGLPASLKTLEAMEEFLRARLTGDPAGDEP